MPHVDFLLGLVFGALVGSFAVDTLCTERAGDFAFPGGESCKGFLVGAISGAVLNYVRNVETERSGICLAFGVALPSGIADMKVCRMVYESMKEINALSVEDGMD